jgi:hypothetical protein
MPTPVEPFSPQFHPQKGPSLMKKKRRSLPDPFDGPGTFVAVPVDLQELPQFLRDQIDGYRDEGGLPAVLCFFEFDQGKPSGSPAKYVLLENEEFLKIVERDHQDVGSPRE